MKSQLNPELTLALKAEFPLLGLHKLGFRGFDGEVDVPLLVVDTVDDSDSSFGVGNTGGQFDNTVFSPEEGLSGGPNLPSGGFSRLAA